MVLGHKIVFEHLRPSFPPSTPSDFKLLAEKCWHPDPKQRPSFDVIFGELREMREQIDGGTLPLRKMDAISTQKLPPMPSMEPMLSVAQFAPLTQKGSESGSIVADSVAAAYVRQSQPACAEQT